MVYYDLIKSLTTILYGVDIKLMDIEMASILLKKGDDKIMI